MFANRTYPDVPPAQVEGSALVDWFPPAQREAVSQALRRVFAGAGAQRLEYAIPDPKGQVRSYVTTITPLVQGTQVDSAVLTAVDVSDLKAAEQAVRELAAGLEMRVQERTVALQQAVERAEAASRAKSEFRSRMSHELRTPMNAILGFAQIIELSQPTPRQRQWAGEIRRAGEHLLQMIDDLLDLARIEIGKMAVRAEPLVPAAVVAEAVAIVQPLAEARGLRLAVDAGVADVPAVRADRLRLRQVLVNFLSNAAKYNRDGGSIRVHAKPRDGRWRLVVADTGIGISPERLERLFRPFERLGAEHGSVEGTGIGLALSKQLADLMGASVGATSRVGEGSAFWIELPAAAASPAAEPLERAAAAADDAPPVDVLYVEDNAANAALVADFLATVPAVTLRVAADGLAGLAAARERGPDVLLLDVQVPGIDGHEVLRRWRADPDLRTVPVVALSADAMAHDVQRALAAGFDRYLTKPVDLATLRATLQALRRAPAVRPSADTDDAADRADA